MRYEMWAVEKVYRGIYLRERYQYDGLRVSFELLEAW